VISHRQNRGRPSKNQRPFRQIVAWCVHFYTALGLVAAAGMAVCIVQGGPENFHRGFILMVVATLIDATDGTLARRVRVKEILPGFDGRRLDDIVDFLTYTCLPLLMIWRAEILPEGFRGWLLFPLLASAYGFSQVCAKTDDGYFLGFPSYWNLVAFYLYIMRPSEWIAVAILVTLSILTFVPSRYLYPTQKGRLNLWTNLFGAAWAGLIIWIVVNPGPHQFGDSHSQKLTIISLVFPFYYLAMSWIISLRMKFKRRKHREQEIRRAFS
jgi:phosphatidylcholine synthase